jgi:coenzyme F420-reducing hydrogenase gamma subunit
LVQLGALGSDRLLLELVDVVVVQGAVVDERRLREELEAAERWVAAGCPLPATPSPGSTGSTGSTGETREATDDARHERG